MRCRATQRPTSFRSATWKILTIESFAYLRLPLAVAAFAFLLGAIGTMRASGKQVFFAAALDDGDFLSRGSAGAGGLRSLYVVATISQCAAKLRLRAS